MGGPSWVVAWLDRCSRYIWGGSRPWVTMIKSKLALRGISIQTQF